MSDVGRKARGLGPLIGPAVRSPLGSARVWIGIGLVKLVVLGALATNVAAIAARWAGDIAPRLNDPITVAVWATGLESADAAVARATGVLEGVNGVMTVRDLDPGESDAVVARLMSAGLGAPKTSADEMRLLVIDTAKPASVVVDQAARALQAAQITARLDDHTWAGSPILRAVVVASAAVAGAFAAIAGALAVACAAVTRREMASRNGAIDLLRLSGASDGFIAGLFVGRSARLALWAGCLGVASAAVVTGLWVRYGMGSPLDVLRPVSRIDLAWSLVWPVIAALIALVAARVAARGSLRRTG